MNERASLITNSTYSRFCKLRVVENDFPEVDYIEVCPSPAFCMHYLARLASDASYLVECPSEIEIDGVYNDYRLWFVWCGAFGQMADPHYTPTYYTIVKNL